MKMLLFFLHWACYDAGSWHHVRLGPPMVDLRDHALRAHNTLGTPRPAASDGKPSGIDAIEQLMSQAVSQNGLRLDHETSSNGDCGPDAVLRNLLRLELGNQQAQRIVRHFRSHGRDAALQALRDMLLLWVRQNAGLEIVEGTTIGQWIQMEGYGSVEEYIQYMCVPRTWVDTPMLMAASGVFNMQFIVFVGPGEPELIVAPQHMSSNQDLPVGFLANCGNVHYYACEPDAGDEPSATAAAAEMTGDVLLQNMPERNGIVAEKHDETPPTEDQCVRPVPAAEQQAEPRAQALFGLCECMSRWDSFDAPPPELADIVKHQEPSDLGSMSDLTLQTLQWRDAYKLAQWEELERQAGIDRGHVYQVAKKQLALAGRACGRYRTFVKSRKIANKLSLGKVIGDIEGPCHKRGSAHTCLDVFRLQPRAVLLWRRLWYALPKQDRDQRLTREFATAAQNHAAARLGDQAGFQMQYRWFGSKVCRDAFIALTGIHADTLQRARRIAMGEERAPLPPCIGAWVMHRPLAYINARAWLLAYARTHADTSPMNDKLWLPAGRKRDIFAVYLNDRRAKHALPQHVASESYFLKVWRQELAWLRLRAASGPFTHCGLCDYLRLLISEAVDQHIKEALLLKLGQHYEFQSAQRIAMANIFADSERNPSEVLVIGWDKMDQAKTILPRVKALSNTQFQKGGTRLIVHLIGVLAPAVWSRPLFYTVFENQVQGSDMICSLLMDVLAETVAQQGSLPRRLVIQADNTPKETKNTITLATAVWLLVQLQHTRLEAIEFCYLIVGHTHDLIDAVFAFVSRALHAQDVLSLPDMFTQLNAKMKRPPMWKHLRNVWGFKDSRPKSLTADNIKGIALPHHLRVSWSRDGNICVQAKRWITSPDWSPPQILVHAEEIKCLRRWWAPPLGTAWPKGFQGSALGWLDKLQSLLEQSGRDCRQLDHLRALIRDELPEYLPSGDSLESYVHRMRQRASGHSPALADSVGALAGLDAAITTAFPGAIGGGQHNSMQMTDTGRSSFSNNIGMPMTVVVTAHVL